jgi:hypothetical protein
MKTTIPKPKPEPKWEPCTLRDDPSWQGHYNAILGGLFSANFHLDWNALPEPEVVNERAAHLVAIAYVGACQAHCQAFISDPNPEVEVERLNEIIGGGTDE